MLGAESRVLKSDALFPAGSAALSFEFMHDALAALRGTARNGHGRWPCLVGFGEY